MRTGTALTCPTPSCSPTCATSKELTDGPARGPRPTFLLPPFRDFLCFLWLFQQQSRRERSHAHRPVTSLADGGSAHAGGRPAAAAAAPPARPRTGARD